MKRILLCVLCLLFISGCGTPTETVDYSRLPLKSFNFNMQSFGQQEIDEYFCQLIFDTPQTRNMAYKIHLTLMPNGHGNLTGDFSGIENAPMNKLIDQAIFTTLAIECTYCTSSHETHESCQHNNIVSITARKATEDGMALGDIFYAEDIEQTLIYLYGEYPVAGESYRDHFSDADHIEYYPEEGLFLQRFDWGGSRSIPQILALNETKDTIVCDFVTVTCGQRYDHYYYEVEYEQELTADNFLEETAGLDVLRFTYHYAADDGRPILYSVETLGKLGSLLHLYGLEQAAENTSNTDLETASKYTTEADFLNHPDGVKFQATAYRAAKAYLNGDTEEVAWYLTDSCIIDDVKLNLFKDVDYMILKWSLSDIKSEDNIRASYEFLLKGEDSVSYVSMILVKVNDEWKADSIGLEK